MTPSPHLANLDRSRCSQCVFCGGRAGLTKIPHKYKFVGLTRTAFACKKHHITLCNHVSKDVKKCISKSLQTFPGHGVSGADQHMFGELWGEQLSSHGVGDKNRKQRLKITVLSKSSTRNSNIHCDIRKTHARTITSSTTGQDTEALLLVDLEKYAQHHQARAKELMKCCSLMIAVSVGLFISSYFNSALIVGLFSVLLHVSWIWGAIRNAEECRVCKRKKFHFRQRLSPFWGFSPNCHFSRFFD